MADTVRTVAFADGEALACMLRRRERAVPDHRPLLVWRDDIDPTPLPGDHKILTLPNVSVTCHAAANSNESYVQCQTHAAREVAGVLIVLSPTTEVKDPWLLTEAQEQGFGGV